MKKMIRPVALFASIVLSVLAFAPSAFAGTHKLELKPAKSQIRFESKAVGETIVGTINGVKSEGLTISFADKTVSGTISFPVKAMNTGNGTRDRHIRSKQWLSAKKNPNITFKLEKLGDVKEVKAKKGVAYSAQAFGQVTVNGVAQPARARVRVVVLKEKGIAKIEIKNMREKDGDKFAGGILLAQHKVAGKKGVVGKKVAKVITITGTLYAKVSQ